MRPRTGLAVGPLLVCLTLALLLVLVIASGAKHRKRFRILPTAATHPAANKIMLPIRPAKPSILRQKWVKQIGRYRLIRWSKRGDDWDDWSDDLASLVLRDPEGHAIVQLSGSQADLTYIGDLTGEGVPDVILYNTHPKGVGPQDGAYYIYSLGRRPRCLLVYNKGGIGGMCEHDFDPVDLDGDGRKEIMSCYDGFEYYNASWTMSAHIPLIFGYRAGRYVDVTRTYRTRLRLKLAENRDFLKQRIREGPPLLNPHDMGDHMGPYFTRVIECYALSLLVERQPAAFRKMAKLLPKQPRRVFLQRHREIEQILSDRVRRFTYPRCYVEEIDPDYRESAENN